MAKIDGDNAELTDRDAALVKGMLERGDYQHHIAAWFGVDSRAVSLINKESSFPNVQAASAKELPPPGPYRPDPTYVRFYQTMVEVNDLWQQRRMKDAKAILEAALRSPMLPVNRSDIDAMADDLLRDEFGVCDQ